MEKVLRRTFQREIGKYLNRHGTYLVTGKGESLKVSIEVVGVSVSDENKKSNKIKGKMPPVHRVDKPIKGVEPTVVNADSGSGMKRGVSVNDLVREGLETHKEDYAKGIGAPKRIDTLEQAEKVVSTMPRIGAFLPNYMRVSTTHGCGCKKEDTLLCKKHFRT